jgi:hypothetical protein
MMRVVSTNMTRSHSCLPLQETEKLPWKCCSAGNSNMHARPPVHSVSQCVSRKSFELRIMKKNDNYGSNKIYVYNFN